MSGVRYQGSGIRGQVSGVRYQGSGIRGQGIGITPYPLTPNFYSLLYSFNFVDDVFSVGIYIDYPKYVADIDIDGAL